MYSPEVVEQTLYSLRKRHIHPKPHPIEQSQEFSRLMKSLVIAKTQKYKRTLSSGESQFLRDETILCRVDFGYFATRYGSIALDASAGGGIGPMKFWTSQKRALEIIAKREIETRANFQKFGFSDGILTVWHKSRQLGATAIMRLITLHRMLFHKHTRCVAGSLDIDKIHELYIRDKTIVDNLPPYLAPKIEFDVKDGHLSFLTGSRLTYQQSNQRAGVGTGQQFDVSHMTEVSTWEYAERLKLDFLPAVPQSPNTFVAFESTANGRGNFWHEFSEDVRLKRPGFQGWSYIFTPWYIEKQKYRRIYPEDWVPNLVTQEHAALVERTSPEFCGEKVTLAKEQLYWWETEYLLHKQESTLHIFLSNYCATPEQSFQHSTRSALPLETIEWMRSTAKLGMPYTPYPARTRV